MTTSAPVRLGLREEPRRLLRQVLHVAVEEQHVREVAGEDAREAGAHRVALAAVLVVREHLGAGGARPLRRPIGRSIVDDDDRGRRTAARRSTTLRNRRSLR